MFISSGPLGLSAPDIVYNMVEVLRTSFYPQRPLRHDAGEQHQARLSGAHHRGRLPSMSGSPRDRRGIFSSFVEKVQKF